MVEGAPVGTAVYNRIVKNTYETKLPGILCVKKQYAEGVRPENEAGASARANSRESCV